MTNGAGAHLLRNKKRWGIAKWACMALLAGSIAVALAAAVSRLQNTVDMIDDGTAGSSEYRRMSEQATTRTLVAFGVGCAAMLGYLACFVMHQRSTRTLNDWRDHQRRAKLSELQAGEEEPSREREL